MRRSSHTISAALAALLFLHVAAAGVAMVSATVTDLDAASQSDGGAVRGTARGAIGFLGKLHPFAVHFPIALLVMAGILEALFMRRGNQALVPTVQVMLVAAAALSVIAAGLGFAAAGNRTVAPELGTAFGIHRIFGIVTAGLAVLTVGLAQRARTPDGGLRLRLYRIVLLIAVIAVLIAGHAGATLVFGRGYFGLF
jgi:uncharacterized membrane protein